MKSMKVLTKHKPQVGIWMDEAPVPDYGPNDIRIKVMKTAICGTDVHIYNWDEWSRKTISVPMIIGHEFVGTVEAMGSEVKDFKKGDRVSGEGHLTCGYCRNCRAGKRHLCRNTVGVGVNRSGCFAEYLTIPAGNVFKVPDIISDDIAAILDPLGNATHTTLSFDLVGEDVLITGAGPIGIMAVAIAKNVGARFVVITDVNDYRLNLAGKMGATRTLNVTRDNIAATMKELDMKEGFDVGLEMSGSPEAFGNMVDHMNYGGKIALLGIPPQAITVDMVQIVIKGLWLKGIYGREMFETWYKMATMLQGDLDISAVITHRFHVDQYQEAFDVMRLGQSGKVLLEW
jgi:threonine 3-dehydrogenase